MPVIIEETQIEESEVSDSGNTDTPCELFNCKKTPTELTSIIFPNGRIVCKIYLCNPHLMSPHIRYMVMKYLRELGLRF